MVLAHEVVAVSWIRYASGYSHTDQPQTESSPTGPTTITNGCQL